MSSTSVKSSKERRNTLVLWMISLHTIFQRCVHMKIKYAFTWCTSLASRNFLKNVAIWLIISFQGKILKRKTIVRWNICLTQAVPSSPEKKRLANFTEEQIRLITEFAKSTKLFRQDVSEEDMANLFNCQLLTPLQANVNRHVALFFGALRQYGLLPFSWQMIIEENKLISSSANNQPLRASNLRCGLSQAKNTKLAKEKSSLNRLEDIGFEATCNAFVKKLKESM